MGQQERGLEQTRLARAVWPEDQVPVRTGLEVELPDAPQVPNDKAFEPHLDCPQAAGSWSRVIPPLDAAGSPALQPQRHDHVPHLVAFRLPDQTARLAIPEAHDAVFAIEGTQCIEQVVDVEPDTQLS